MLSGALTSCSDFLDQKSPSSLDGANIFATEEYAEGTIANIYTQFTEQNYRARSIWYGYNTDVEFFGGSKNADGKADLATYAAGVANDQMNVSSGTDLWAKIYSAIERANLAMEGLRANADLNNPVMKQLLGEAITLRALHYMDLINMWGDVPARLTSLNSENMYGARADRDIIYKQLIADLQEAQDLCAWPNELKATQTVERVNKAFVKGLLARVCLQAAGYAQRMDGENRLSTDPELSKEVLYPIALQACKDVMAVEGTYVKLKQNFEDIWNNNGISGDVISAGSESLFEIGYANGDNGSAARGRIMYTFGLKHNIADDMTTMLQGSQVGPMPTLYWDYGAKDTRRDVTCVPYQWGNNKVPSTKGTQVIQSLKGWSFGKLRYEWTNRMIPSGNDDGINKIYMRYADIVLMRAELENELNGPSAAKEWLKKIRKRAYGGAEDQTGVVDYVDKAASSKQAMFDAIVEERGLEFAGELVRKADLIRWGKLKSSMDIAKAKMASLVALTDYDDAHPYSQLSGHLYFKMANFTFKRADQSYTLPNARLVLYGLNYGETDLDPEGYEEYTNTEGAASTWIKENALDDVIPYLYVNDPDKRQYWPIFNVNLNDNPNLENYSWY